MLVELAVLVALVDELDSSSSLFFSTDWLAVVELDVDEVDDFVLDVVVVGLGVVLVDDFELEVVVVVTGGTGVGVGAGTVVVCVTMIMLLLLLGREISETVPVYG